jgi:hypothetical protein
MGDVVLMGDFNSRTGLRSDCPNYEGDKYLPMPAHDTYSLPVPRQSHDRHDNCTYGKQLLNMCASTGLFIANGRVFGDTRGVYTCHQYSGSSVVDYLLVSNDIISQLRYFKVHEFTGTLSDHCKLSFGLSVQVHSSVEEVINVVRPPPIKFHWDGDSYLSQLTSSDVTNHLMQFENSLPHEPDINTNVSALSEILLVTAQ